MHSEILLTFIKLPVVIKIFVLSIFEWPFYTDFTVLYFPVLEKQSCRSDCRYTGWSAPLSFSCNQTRFSNNETHVIYLIVKLINLSTLIKYPVQNSVPRIQNSITNCHMNLLYFGPAHKNKVAHQSVQMHRLVCTFAALMQQNTVF